MHFSIRKLLFMTVLPQKRIITSRPPSPPCSTCEFYSNQKCFYYRVLVDKYVVDYYDQIMEQEFATQRTAMDVHTAREDEQFCGKNARHWRVRDDI